MQSVIGNAVYMYSLSEAEFRRVQLVVLKTFSAFKRFEIFQIVTVFYLSHAP